MKRLLLILALLCGSGEVWAASNDVLLNLRDPSATSPLFPTLRVDGKADGATNPTVKLPVLPCVANAAAPTWTEGSIVPCSVDLAGGMRQSGGSGGGNGAILDFVNSLIGATVRDYVNSNPLAVVLTDTNGDAYLASGGGTQYNQGTVATDTDTMTMAGCVRADTAAIATGVADGDRARCIVDSTNRIWTRVGTIDGGTLTSITNPVAVTQSGVWTTGRTWALSSGTDSVTALVSNAFLLDATFTGRLAAAYVDADTIANQTTTVVHGNNYMYNGATWDRIRGSITDGILVNLGTNNDVTVTGTVAVSNAFLLDATFTGRFPVAYVDADTIANQTTTAVHGQGYFYNGATWDRMRGTIAGGLLVDVSDAFVLDATVTNRLPAGSTPADNESNAITTSRLGAFNYIFDGATWDRWTGAVSQSGTWNIGTVTTVTTVGAVTSITNPVTVLGNKTHNNAAPGATNVGTLPCIATAVAPTNTEGNQTGCSQNLSGAQRTIEQNFVATANNDGSCASGAASFTAIASNASRTWLAVWASPANTDDVYLKLGATATAADARFAPGQPLNFTSGRIYTGIIDAFPASGTQAVCVMELN